MGFPFLIDNFVFIHKNIVMLIDYENIYFLMSWGLD